MIDTNIGNYLDMYTVDFLMERALAKVPDTIDKREGSIIYDALRPAIEEIGAFYMELKIIVRQTYAATAVGEELRLRVAERGVIPYEATYAKRKGVFKREDGAPFTTIPMGSRFSTISDEMGVNFTVTDFYRDAAGSVVPGTYILTSEELGAIGNEYLGNILPITFISGLSIAEVTDIIVPGRDMEDDEDLRKRFFEEVDEKPFGGNVAQYDSMIKDIAGVGEVQVFPIWNGGGTVKLSIIGADFETISPDFINIIQELVDPENGKGQGIGLAPIGHYVTVTTPDRVPINIETTIVPQPNYTVAQLQPQIEEAISEYLLTLRKAWGLSNSSNEYALSVYKARIDATMLMVPGVANVIGTTLNGSAFDLDLEETKLVQELPVLGSVVLNG